MKNSILSVSKIWERYIQACKAKAMANQLKTPGKTIRFRQPVPFRVVGDNKP